MRFCLIRLFKKEDKKLTKQQNGEEKFQKNLL